MSKSELATHSKSPTETETLLRSRDWSSSPLGPMETWPASLLSTVSTILRSKFPSYIIWGPSKVQIYNDAYIALLGPLRHPKAFGGEFRDVWPELADDFIQMFEKVESGESFFFEDVLLHVHRTGTPEDAYFTFSLSPVVDENGKIHGTLCTCFETTGRVQSEANFKNSMQVIAQSEAELIDTLDSMSDAFFALDKNWTIIRVNKQHEKLSKLTREKQVGRSFLEVFFSDPSYENSTYLKSYRKVMAERVPVTFEDYYEPLKFWTEVRVYPTGDGGIAAFFTDITERKTAQLDYERSVDVSPAILWITETDGSCTYLSKQWYEFTGQTEEEALGFGWLNATHPDDMDRAAKTYNDSNAKQIPFYAEYRLRTKSGDYRWAIDAGNPRFDTNGQYLGYAGTVFDIHDQKMVELEAQENERNLKLALLNGQMGTWHLDLKTNVLSASNEASRIVGDADTINEDVGQMIARMMHPDDVPEVNRVLAETVRSKSVYSHEYRIVRPNGEIRWLLSQGSAVIDDQGDAKAYSGIIMDITDRKEAEAALQLAKDEAERANSLKSAFLANMSHEIRTPLGAMMGFADLLRDPNVTASERQSFTNIMTRNGESLSVIINDILDLSKVEAGHLTLEFTDTDPAQIGADVVSLLRVKANEKDLVLEYSHDEDGPASIVADPTRVRQILLNLVSNAIKFTQFGSVKLRSFSCQSELGRRSLCFEITDTGIGISKDQVDRIFEMFVQADGSMTRRFGGTGLGLSLSRSLARAMGGDIVVTETREGIGSTFLVTIADQPEMREESSVTPARKSAEAPELPLMALEGVKILVVDDAPDNQQLIWRFLTKQGAIVESAENGLIGYRTAIAGDFDLVLMDIQMPVMDGYMATQKLRDAGYRKPIIALTAHAMNEVRRKAFNVGYSDHLTKPINSRELISTIVRHVRG